MAIVPIFYGKIDQSGRFIPANREQWEQHRNDHKGKLVEVTLRKLRTKRSVDQNAYLHGVVVPLMIEYTGDDVAGTKLSLMGEKWGWKRDPLTGRELPVKPHTSDMTVDEFSEFIEWVGPWARLNHGVDIPLPREVDYAEDNA